MRNLIAILILAVYSIVLAHSFIPHHHHSEFNSEKQVCQLEKHQEPQEQTKLNISDCCIEHNHDDHSNENHCSFNEKTILAKSINLSEIIVPFTEFEFDRSEKIKNSFGEKYIPLQIQNAHCRAVQLRGPPQFS